MPEVRGIPRKYSSSDTRDKNHSFHQIMRGHDEKGNPLKVDEVIKILPNLIGDALKNDTESELSEALSSVKVWWKCQQIGEIDAESMADFLIALLDQDPLCRLDFTQFVIEEERVIRWWFYQDTRNLSPMTLADLTNSLFTLDPGRSLDLTRVVLSRFVEVCRTYYPDLILMAEEQVSSFYSKSEGDYSIEEDPGDTLLVMCFDRQGCFIDVDSLIEEADQLFSGGNLTIAQASA